MWNTKLTKKQLVYLILCNDSCLVTTKKKSKYHLKWVIPLRNGIFFRPHQLFVLVCYLCFTFVPHSLVGATVEKIDSVSHNFEFRLHDRSRGFFFYADSADARKDWMKMLQLSMDGTHEGDNKTKIIQQAMERHEAYSATDSSSGTRLVLSDLF
jgi:hypothetical protein